MIQDVMPTVAIEVGWSESLPHVHNDMDLLLAGSRATRVVILIKWNKRQGGRVAGIAEVFTKDQFGVPQLDQSEVCSRHLINLSYTYCLLCRLSSPARLLDRTKYFGSAAAIFLGGGYYPGVTQTILFPCSSTRCATMPLRHFEL
jgi:hypothetical protein